MEHASAPIGALLRSGSRQLAAAGIRDAEIESRLLLQFVTGLSRTQLMLDADVVQEPALVNHYHDLLDKRCQRIPLQHLTGVQDFWSLELIVSPAVLIPRPETEFLIEQVLAKLHPKTGLRVLDMCTGSGAIALVLAQELDCSVVGVDLSPEALWIAQQNRSQYHLEEQVALVQSDLFAALAQERIFDCIVSNPPYIADSVIEQLEPEVACFEPRMALSGGQDGLDCIQRIITQAPNYLQVGGWLFLEIGSDQQEAVISLLQAATVYEQAQVLSDYAGQPRVALARLCC
ncbi:peptide chain release factor N(5)-glutamine methyltransferase [Desulfobulbus rhabdoformis]|uniref:peptide chain release factor N(5)-glutamine methyltransferase n=1 Tax=Desulfobulbus rhabdoformis TaxID=34032 RepID=UPI0019636910|nr:peptide chain release factor N(5)-glutamine methyltransferase [Desulfobulbus rhabdoformis]